MKSFPPIERPTPLTDNMFAPEILAGGTSGLSLINGILTITFENARCDHTQSHGPYERVVVARVSMPVVGAQGLFSALSQFLNQNGINPMVVPGAVTRQ